jgi:Holliday junction DNA helicase RuvB
VVEEYLYPAMEDFRLEIPVGDGPNAEMLPLKLPRFSLVAATTRTGLLSAPFLSRFGIVLRLEYYSPLELTEIVRRSARKLGVAVDEAGAQEIGRRARGTPRIANHLLKRVRDFAEVEGDGRVTQAIAASALARLGVDQLGLDDLDRLLLRTIIEKFDGGPVGVESLAAACAEERDTLEDVCEPYLIQEGFIMRTPRGRVATRRAHEHLGLPPPRQGSLL